MEINMEIVLVVRYHTPANRNTDATIKSINKTIVGTFNTNVLPAQGEIIKYKSVNYEVLKVIRVIDDWPCETFTLQVAKHDTTRIMKNGSDSWKENIPLCVDIK